ncbi:thap domain-containing [Lasius niger]|uniref:Thap domain-containing n=1 Tax=Lasius niger TaxID=67767 RepID=A0A0J7K6V9_LASNI|nr:thap domain-containing [Lasius niger]
MNVCRRTRVETELKRMNVLLENILKYVKEKQQVSHKPAILPISSLTEMETFETIDDDTYYDVRLYVIINTLKNQRVEFQAQMKETLRTAKERLRSKIRPRKQFVTDVTIRRNMWNDDA